MREILYRAKAINRDSGYHRTNYKNGDFVYGLITRLYDERFENLPAEMTDINGITGIEVDYKTIGQYTGLTDKNSTRIFEGDIVRDLFKHIGVVEFSTENIGSCGCCYPEFSGSGFKAEGVHLTNCEVIGNKFDTPELLNRK